MKPPKKPPPDTEGNLRGRMRLLRTVAKQNARVDEREGGDYERALAKHTRAVEPRLAKLKVRMARVLKATPVPKAPVPKKGSSKARGPVEVAPSKRAKAVAADLLDELGAL